MFSLNFLQKYSHRCVRQSINYTTTIYKQLIIESIRSTNQYQTNKLYTHTSYHTAINNNMSDTSAIKRQNNISLQQDAAIDTTPHDTSNRNVAGDTTNTIVTNETANNDTTDNTNDDDMRDNDGTSNHDSDSNTNNDNDNSSTITLIGPFRWVKTNSIDDKLKTLNLGYTEIFKENNKSSYITLIFNTVHDKQNALNILSNNKTIYGTSQNQKLRIKNTPGYILKRKRQYEQNDREREQEDNNKNKRQGTDNDNNNDKPRSAVEVVCPLYNLPYDIQLRNKLNTTKKTLRGIYKNWTQQYKHEINLSHNTEGMICNITDIVPSPIINGYRNKCELACGYDKDGNKIAGYQLGRFRDGVTVIGDITECINTPDITIYIARLFTDYMRQSQYNIYDKITRQGVFRLLTVRNSLVTKQLMVNVNICTNELTEQQVNELQQDIKQYFIEHTSSEPYKLHYDYVLTSLLIRIHNDISDVVSDSIDPIVLYGQSYITEQLSDLSFNINLTSFFQVNIKSAELLYSRAIYYAQCNQHTLLFDICCGTGTIAQIASRHVRHVIGIEMIQSAVNDAYNNAKQNNINNCTFICGKAEDVLESAMRQYITDDIDNISVVVDPPRGGLHPKVCKLLRNTTRIQRIVYVSCNIKTMLIDIEKLCKPSSKQWTGQQYTPVESTLFDMFPHTQHTEAVITLQR